MEEKNMLEPKVELDLETSAKKEWFQILGHVSIFYALLFTICLYQNFTAITMPIWIIGTLGSVFYVMRKLHRERKKDSDHLIVFMILLGISTVFTGNGYIIFMNYVLYIILFFSWLLHQFREASNWTLSEQLGKIIELAFGALECIDRPFFEGTVYFRSIKKEKNEKHFKMLLGVVLSIPVLIFLGFLLASADAVFENFMKSALGGFTIPSEMIKILLFLLFGFLSFYCKLRFLGQEPRKNFISMKEKKDATAYIAFTGSITLLYLAFSLVQIIYLFAGLGCLPEGMTYAQYARTGFFQLLFVSVLNLLLILVLQKKVQKNRILTGILTTICFCTLVMIASSFYRMILYIEAYHLTFLRVFVLVSLVVITFLILGAMVTLYRERFTLTRYAFVVVSMIYLAFSFSHVDYFIAKYNLEHMTHDNKYETLSYIGSLSSDAAPVITDYIENQPELVRRVASFVDDYRKGKDVLYADEWMETEWIYNYALEIEQIREHIGIRTFNFSHYRAVHCFE